jgi:hypothetical protein
MDFQQEFSKPSSSSVLKFNKRATLYSRAAILTSSLVPDLMNDVIEVQCRSDVNRNVIELRAPVLHCYSVNFSVVLAGPTCISIRSATQK